MGRTCLVEVLLVFVVLLSMITTHKGKRGFALGCHDQEREALLKFKRSVSEPTNRLISWEGLDCCRWQGVICHNVTGHVQHLDLRTDLSSCVNVSQLGQCEIDYESQLYFDKLDPSLLELRQLRYLDLSGNYFYYSRIPESIGSLKHLRYLNLSIETALGEVIPPQIGNLTSLQSLDLSNLILTHDQHWLSGLVNLKYLSLTMFQINMVQDFMQALIKLHSLSELRISFCTLGNIPHFSAALSNSSWLSKIQHLDLSYNYLEGSLPLALANMTSLRHLDLSGNKFTSTIPLWLGNLRKLEYLSLGNNVFESIEGGIVMDIISSLCMLKLLDFSYNSILKGEIVGPLTNFSQCSTYDLETFDLSYNNISGALPLWLGELRNLKIFSVENNRLLGPIPTSIGNLSFLEELHLNNCGLYGYIPSSLRELASLKILKLSLNFLEGVVSNSLLANLSSLEVLDLSSNSLKLNLSSDWIPPFRLQDLRMRSCRIDGPFPHWLQTQNTISFLDLSSAGISGKLPEWLPNMINLQNVNLSHNHIRGEIGHFPSKLSTLDLSTNLLSGPLLQHPFAERVLHGMSLCHLKHLELLDLQKNQLSGAIPDCWGYSEDLSVINLSSNKFSGIIPLSLGLLSNLAYLKLNNNSLEGKIPATISSCSKLLIVDLGENKLSGEIPKLGGDSLILLTVLRLRANQLSGVIPAFLCSLPVQILDLAENNLTGSIPHCFGHFYGMGSPSSVDAMAPTPSSSADANAPINAIAVPPESPDAENAMEVLKGEELLYTKTLKFVVNLDLSCNGLTGLIPEEITKLSSLIGLNLSYNHLTGNIPENIGEMRSLESLDLSNNNLSGTIPSSMAALTFLSHLNLSYNNLHGEIPSGNQLQTLSDQSTIYAGNPGLCGDQLPHKCKSSHSDKKQQEEDNDDVDDNREKMILYIVIIIGFASGFWGVVGSLVLNKRWRYALFSRVDDVMEYLRVQVVVRINRLRK